MFDNDYDFKGIYAQKITALTNEHNFGKSNVNFFAGMVDFFIVAPIIGLLYGRRSEKDTGGDTKTVFFKQFIVRRSEIDFAWRAVMLCNQSEPQLERRIKRAFNTGFSNEAEEASAFALFESYMLGGIDVLYEKLIERDNATGADDYLSNLCAFVEEVHERFDSAPLGIDEVFAFVAGLVWHLHCRMYKKSF